MNTTQQKYMLLLKTLYNPEAGIEERESVRSALHQLTETEQVDFNNFQHIVGEHFLKVKEELDQGLEDMADAFPDRTDPRQWDEDDWLQFYTAIAGHKFEAIYVTYARQKANLHLMWEEIEKRI